jgi:hypothetical protein
MGRLSVVLAQNRPINEKNPNNFNEQRDATARPCP